MTRRKPGSRTPPRWHTTRPIPPPWPLLPEPAASRPCHDCSWCWLAGAMRIKHVNRACSLHGRYAQ
jgi:hypothetical protein